MILTARRKFTKPRWVNRYLPVWMMAVGLVGAAIFAGLAGWSADAWEDADVERYARFAMFAGCFFLAGCFLCVISNLWILISAVAFLIRRKRAKQV
jgi:MFS family permease